MVARMPTGEADHDVRRCQRPIARPQLRPYARRRLRRKREDALDRIEIGHERIRRSIRAKHRQRLLRARHRDVQQPAFVFGVAPIAAVHHDQVTERAAPSLKMRSFLAGSDSTSTDRVDGFGQGESGAFQRCLRRLDRQAAGFQEVGLRLVGRRSATRRSSRRHSRLPQSPPAYRAGMAARSSFAGLFPSRRADRRRRRCPGRTRSGVRDCACS